MRRYADPVEVRRGPLDDGSEEGPDQFLWRGRLWKVRAVLGHWVETGPWWQSAVARAAVGAEDDAAAGRRSGADGSSDGAPPRVLLGDLLTERELWRVEAGRGRPRPVESGRETEPDPSGTGVFDLSFDWAEGRWTLVGCAD